MGLIHSAVPKVSTIATMYMCATQILSLSRCENQQAFRRYLWPSVNYVLSRNYSKKSKRKSKSKPKEQKLLRFPAFPLEETMQRFLRTTKPLLSQKEYNQTVRIAKHFMAKDGAKLQKLLEKAAKKEVNWLAHRWLRAAYLQNRLPVTVYSSPGMTFPIQKPFENVESLLKYTAKVIYCLLRYKQLVDHNKIPVVKMGKFTLDNSQFGKVFGTCRIPKENEDGISYNPSSKHIVLIYRNQFYKVPVYNNCNKILHVDVLAEQIFRIVKAENECVEPIGILTLGNRDKWAKAYKYLQKCEMNKTNLKNIQTSLFTVSLDCTIPPEKGLEFITQSEQLMHGGGSRYNSGNRWMDKTIQVIINANGMSGFTYEHSPAEGQPIALMADFITANLTKSSFFKSGAKNDYEGSEPLIISCNNCVKCLIKNVTKDVNKLVKNLDINVLHFKLYGKDFIKKLKLSPDSFIQTIQQLAFYRLHRKPGAHYESAHLRMYKNGRTETIRSCSIESVAFAKAMTNPKVCNDDRKKLLVKAVLAHRAYTILALQGKGVDRHLLGLRLMAIENCMKEHKFFKSPGFRKSSHFRIATSQVATPNLAFMTYGPSTLNGYSCCYNPRNRDIILACTAWRNNKSTSVDRFAVELSNSFEQVQRLLACNR